MRSVTFDNSCIRDFRAWLAANEDALSRSFRLARTFNAQLDYFEWVPVQHERQLERC